MTTYTLPDLPYSESALEPHISGRVMELHHGTHHAAYVKGANETLDKLASSGSGAQPAELSQLARTLAFHVSGHALHSLFWTNMGPDGAREPQGALAGRIETDFGGYDALRQQLGGAVSSLQGSGWGALCWEPMAGRLIVQQIHDHQDHHAIGSLPLLVIDGWEHAWYLDHQADKAAWIKAFWEVVDWTAAARMFESVSEPAAARL